MLKNKPTIGITIGDPGGIGPEITAKSLADPALKGLANFIIIGDAAVYGQDNARALPENATFHDEKIITHGPDMSSLDFAERGAASYQYLQTGIAMLKDKTIEGIVTAPVNKQAIMASGIDNFCGHTEMFAQAFEIDRVEMMFAGGPFKTIIATRHIPLRDIANVITTENILKTITLADECLTTVFKIPEPKIAVCGLNPHAGEGGKMGREEINIISPAIAAAQQSHINVSGPFAADTLFIPFNAKRYDLIIAMYHDQGLTSIKALYFKELVNYTIGLPFIRTSTAHGTAEDIAGKGIADPASMTAAIKLACKLTINANIKN